MPFQLDPYHRPHKVRNGYSQFHWEHLVAVAVVATFIAAFLDPYHFLVNSAYHKGTHLGRAPSIYLHNGSAGLDAAQSKEIDRMCMLIREIGERIIIPLLRSVEAEEQHRKLVGFDRRFKDTNRLKHKVADQLRLVPGRTPIEGLAAIPDAVRFTLQYLEIDYGMGVRKDIGRLRGRGLSLVALRNTWTDDQYKGINTRWREPMSGLMFEVQFHTQASLAAKELTHGTYERIRDGAVGVTEMETLRGFQQKVNAKVPIPTGAEDIGEW